MVSSHSAWYFLDAATAETTASRSVIGADDRMAYSGLVG
jgi:hypothetical protein